MINHRKLLSTFIVFMTLTNMASASRWLQQSFDTLQQAPERLHAAVSNSACHANNCTTIQGLINCLQTDADFSSYMTPTRFFQRNAEGLPIQRIVHITTALQPVKSPDRDYQDMSTATRVTVQSVVSLIRPSTYKAFQTVARQNPHCLNTFCNRNCLLINTIPSEYIDRYVKSLKNAIVPATIKGRTYTVYQLRHMDDDARRRLANDHLLDAVNSVITGQCVASNQMGSIVRMLCAECTHTLRDTISRTNVACTSFDPKTEVALTLMEKDDNALYQRELQAAQKKQEAVSADALKHANNPGASVDLHKLVRDLNAALANGSIRMGIEQGRVQFNTVVNSDARLSPLQNLNPAFDLANTAVEHSKGLVAKGNELYNKDDADDQDDDDMDPEDVE